MKDNRNNSGGPPQRNVPGDDAIVVTEADLRALVEAELSELRWKDSRGRSGRSSGRPRSLRDLFRGFIDSVKSARVGGGGSAGGEAPRRGTPTLRSRPSISKGALLAAWQELYDEHGEEPTLGELSREVGIGIADLEAGLKASSGWELDGTGRSAIVMLKRR